MTSQNNYSLISTDELMKRNVELDWFIDDFIPKNSLGMIFGASGSGKSHIILSMAMSVANGQNWFGQDIEKGNVLVLIGEGLNGINKRLKSISKHHKTTLPKANIAFSERGIGLDSDNGITTVKNAIEKINFKPDLIIIDTLSRHLEDSEENSNDDMARFINRLDYLKQEYDCSIILVHHTGKSNNGTARGASVLKANVDFSFLVEPNGKKQCKLICDKMKDADDDIEEKFFDIVQVELGTGKKGKPITGACIAETSVINTPSESKQDKYLQLALDTFKPDKSDWQQAFISGHTAAITDETKKRHFRDSVKDLEAYHQLNCDDKGCYKLTA